MEEIMHRTFVAAFAASGLLAATALVPTSAAAQAETTQVLKTELQGQAAMEANIVRFEVQPGWETVRHIHPGHVFVYVTEGTIEIAVEGQEPLTVSAGEAVYELPNRPMVGRTATADEGARFIVFQVGPTGEPLMVAQPR
jgi:quercetin dioxygenase-like cupin family protein